MTSAISPEAAEHPLILTIDAGSSSIKVSLFDRLGRAVAGTDAHEGHRFRTSVDGGVEGNADQLLELVFRSVDEALAGAGALATRIAGVGTCTFVSNVLGVDATGRALTPLLPYSDDRAWPDVDWLRAHLDEAEVHDITGCGFHASYLPARFVWLARTQPETFRQVARWVSLGEYMELKLFGEAAVSYSVASWTGLLDRRRLVWYEPLLAQVGVRPDQLSPLTDVSAGRHGLRPDFAERWPALRDVPWFPASGDGAMANVGSSCVSPARVAVTVGTTSAVRAVVDTPPARVPAGLVCYRVDAQRSLPEGALTEGGNVFAWIRDTLQLEDVGRLEAALAARQPDEHGLTVLPFLGGERSPGWASDARGTIHGLSFGTTPLDILQAGLEAVAYRLGMVFDLLRPLLPGDPQVVASGGALLSAPTWLQIVADVLGKPVAVSDVPDASARGAALLALLALGALPRLEDAPDVLGAVYQPDPARHARYREAMARQEKLYAELVGPKD